MSVRCAFNSGIPQQAAGIWGNSIVIDTLDEAYETNFIFTREGHVIFARDIAWV
jgi:hypothetical protein